MRSIMAEKNPDGFVFLVNQLHPTMKFWAAPDGTLFADTRLRGRNCAIKVSSPHFVGAVYGACKTKYSGLVPKPKDVEDYQAYVLATEQIHPEVRPVGLRVLADGGALFYNMGGYGADAIKFQGGSWALCGDYPVRFVVGQSQLAQKAPRAPTRAFRDLLADFITCSPRDLMILEAWCIGTFLVQGPYPVLVLHGEQGTAKSTTTRLLAKLVDPCGIDVRRAPSSDRDLAVACYNSHVIALDNISQIKPWLSDALCSIATGTGAIGGRKLYTDFGDASVAQARPIVLNGIPDFVEREDLADRSIGVRLDTIPSHKRRDDASFWAAFDAALPELLGALFDRVAVAWRDFQTIKVEYLPRMSNWARFVAAAFTPQEREEFFAVLKADAAKTDERMLEDNLIAQSIFRVLVNGDWEGSSLRLIGELKQRHPLAGSSWQMPDTPKRMTNALTRLKPILRSAGVVIDLDAGYETGTRRKLVRISKTREYIDRPFVTAT